MDPYKILIVDDEQDVLNFLSYNLKQEGFSVYTACNGSKGVQTAIEVKPHLILLDIMMPEMDGMETCEKIRKIPELASTIIAFLTARGEDYSQIAGFEAGADDYIVKPVKPKVLISRINALLKRITTAETKTEPENQEKLMKKIIVDRDRYLVIKEGKEINLPKKEFELLSLLVSRSGKVLTREEIFLKIWGDDIIVGDRTLDVHIRKLREKIGDHYIVTVKGVGYKFVESPDKKTT